jgi:hypothetical protein
MSVTLLHCTQRFSHNLQCGDRVCADHVRGLLIHECIQTCERVRDERETSWSGRCVVKRLRDVQTECKILWRDHSSSRERRREDKILHTKRAEKRERQETSDCANDMMHLDSLALLLHTHPILRHRTVE